MTSLPSRSYSSAAAQTTTRLYDFSSAVVRAEDQHPSIQAHLELRQILNSDYFFDESPAALPQTDFVGIDMWAMTESTLSANKPCMTSAGTSRIANSRPQGFVSVDRPRHFGIGFLASRRGAIISATTFARTFSTCREVGLCILFVRSWLRLFVFVFACVCLVL